MSILDPSESDKDPHKKPRFRQDLAVIIIFLAGFLLYFLLEWLVW